MRQYDRATQSRLADELDAMGGRYPTVEEALADYGTVRAQCRVTSR